MADYIAPAVAIALPNLGGFAGAIITRRNMANYYDNLKLPWWRPPKKLFGPVWTALYCTMGYSSYMIWRDGGGFGGDAAMPLAIYGTQLALNWSWSPVFFGLQSPKWGLVNIIALLGGILGTIYAFHQINEDAAHMYFPYLGWTTFAACLNAKIWYDNRGEKKEK